MPKEKVYELCIEQVAEVAFNDNLEFDFNSLQALLLEGSEEIIYDDYMLVSFCDQLLADLLKSNYKDARRLCRILDLLSLVRDPSILRARVQGNVGDLMYAVAKGMAKSLDLRRNNTNFHHCHELNYEHVSNAILHGDTELMKVFMRFGVCLSPPTRPVIEEKPSDSEDNPAESTNQANKAKKSEQKYRVPETARAIRYHKCIGDCSCIQYVLKDKSRRSLLVVGAYQCASRRKTKKEEDDTYDQFTCFQLLLQATSDPFVTFAEVKKMLDAGKRQRDSKYWEDVLRDFKTMNPEFQIPHQPRSLLHLCRCVIRTELKKIGSLPYLANQLEIPQTLKKRILADSEDFIL